MNPLVYLRTILACVGLFLLQAPAMAEMVLSEVIVDFPPDEPLRKDIEILNSGSERIYVSVDPSQIVNPGTPQERRIALNLANDNALIVSPRRLVVEPGERRLVRLASVGPRPAKDAIYRLMIRPVAGTVTADTDALKVFVGYDTLVLVRPEQLVDDIRSVREQRRLRLQNVGNTAQELFDGVQCDATGKDCRPLPAKRLYPDAEWDQTLPFNTPVTYKSAIGGAVRLRTF